MVTYPKFVLLGAFLFLGQLVLRLDSGPAQHSLHHST